MEPVTTYNAMLIVGHFIVSVFQYPLGQPVFQFHPYPNMEICEQYKRVNEGTFPINGEYQMVKQAQCMTKEDYDRAVAERQRQLQQQQEQSTKPLPEGWK